MLQCFLYLLALSIMHFHIITLFKSAIEPYLKESILGRAKERGKIKFSFYNPRDFVSEKRNGRVDGKPYGGGPGMVIEAMPILRAIEKAKGKKKNVKVFLLSAEGKEFNSVNAKKYSLNYKHIILIAGHYEGIDARVIKAADVEEISIGRYVLTGGELPALVFIDAVSRFVPNVLGNESSIEENRVSSSLVYTRPEILKYKGKQYKVPEILLSGNHKKIEEWKASNKRFN